MRLNRFSILTLFYLLFLAACSSGGSGDDAPPISGGDDDPPPIPAPSSASLVFPEDDTECNTGVIDPDDDTKSTVTFEWNAAQNTDSYSVTVTNLNTGSSFFANSTTTETDIKIDRGVPYEWFVISRAQGTTETATSATFRFYNEGAGIENYAPFPAEAVNPERGANIDATSSVTLEWSASDVDDDIAEYEIFLNGGIEQDPTTSLGTTAETNLPDVPVTSGTTYYWKVKTTDSQGNSSTSEVFEFKVN
jgi:hypothetical protein